MNRINSISPTAESFEYGEINLRKDRMDSISQLIGDFNRNNSNLPITGAFSISANDRSSITSNRIAAKVLWSTSLPCVLCFVFDFF